MDIFRRDEIRRRYELVIGDQIVFAEYRLDGNILTLPHVEAPVALRGAGAAGRLMAAVMEEARREALRVRPLCGYAARWIERHPEYHDLLA